MAEHNLPKTVRGIGSRVLIVGSGIATLFSAPAAAQSSTQTCGNMPEQFQEIATLLTRIQELGTALALLIASIMIIYGGVLWMRGTPDSQQKARRIVFNALVGLVIVLMAGALVGFVTNILCGGG